MSGLQHRFIRSLGANAFGQLIVMTSQLVQVPLFLYFWTKGLYGEWLVLFSMPALMSLADAGLGTVAANEAVMAAGAGDFEKAQSSISTSWTLQMTILGLLALLTPFGAWFLSTLDVVSLSKISDHEATIVLSLLTWSVLATIPSALVLGIYRASGRNARGTMMLNLQKLLALAGISLALMLGGKVVEVAVGYFLSQLIGMVAMIYDSHSCCCLRLRRGVLRWSDIKRSLLPALGFQIFPLGNALYFQGQTLLVNHVLGSQLVVTFSTLRTLSRLVAQAAATIKHSAWPEFSLLQNSAGREKVARLVKKMTMGCVLLGLAASIVVVVAGPFLLEVWTHHQVEVSRAMIALFVGSALVNAAWAVPSGYLQAINRHVCLAVAYCASCFSALCLSWVFAHAGLSGIGISMLLAELMIFISAVVLVRHRLLSCG